MPPGSRRIAPTRGRLANHRADEVLRLRAQQTLDDLVTEADGLWPAVPENEPRFVDWLARARALLAERPDTSASARPSRCSRERRRLRSSSSCGATTRAPRTCASHARGRCWTSASTTRPWRRPSTRWTSPRPASRDLAGTTTRDRGRGAAARAGRRRASENSGARAAFRRPRAELAGLHPRVFDVDADRWWHGQLGRLVEGLEALGDPQRGLVGTGISPEHGWGVEQTARLRARPAPAHRRRPRDRCAVAHGAGFDRRSGAVPRLSRPRPWNPRWACSRSQGSELGLWEFAQLSTGEPPTRCGREARPARGDRNRARAAPGGTCWIGSQHQNRLGLNFDPEANLGEEPVHEVELSGRSSSRSTR
jgi:hypothetical protein